MEQDVSLKRFTEVRRDQDLTQKEFAKLLGIPATTADVERGRTKITGKVVAELLKQFQINPLWLFGMSDSKFLNPGKVSVIPKVVTVDKADNENMVLVNAKAAAGYPQNIQDVSWYRQLPAFDLPIPEFRNSTYRGFQVEGDSMVPNLQSGDWVMARAIDHIDHVVAHKMYVVVLQDSVMVKKIAKPKNSNDITLISINEDYPPYQIKPFLIQEIWEVSSKLTFDLDVANEKSILQQLQHSMEELKNQLREVKS